MQRAIVLFAVLSAATIFGAHAARAEGALAVGLPAGGLSHGAVYGWATGDDDQAKALKTCQGIMTENNIIPNNASEAQRACKLVATFNDQCVAVSVNGDQVRAATGIGWAFAADLEKAKAQAIALCRKMAGPGKAPCVVQATAFGCDGAARQ
jgi:hypothetical protein